MQKIDAYATTPSASSGTIKDFYANTITVTGGSASAPSFRFSGSPTTGIYNPASNILSFSVNGVSMGRFLSTGFESDFNGTFLSGLYTSSITISNGSASSPAIRFSPDPTTGIYSPSAGVLSFTTSGIPRGRFDGTGKLELDYDMSATSATFTGLISASTAVFTGQVSAASITISGQVSATTATFTGQLIGKGTVTNDAASSGYIGESTAAVVMTANVPGTGAWGDLSYFTLSPGDWDVTLLCYLYRNGATWSDVNMAVSVTAGNNTTGLSTGQNKVIESWASTSSVIAEKTLVIPSNRISIASPTIIYFKIMSDYTSGPPTAAGRMTARRMR
jgi:hypothetical protein